MLQLPESPDQVYRRFRLIEMERLRRQRRKAESRSLIHFMRRMFGPDFIIEEVHLLLAGYIEALVFGEMDRLMQFIAPRTGKSRIASVATPSFYMGNFPNEKIMQIGHSQELSVDFGREAKDLVGSPDFQDVFPGVTLRADAKASGRWFTNKRGAYYASGVGGGIAGKGYNLGSADDLLSEQTAASDTANAAVLRWWGPGFYTRRQPEKNAIMLTMTRWRTDDIAGHLLEKAKNDLKADHYIVLRVPAIIDEVTAEMLNEAAGDPILRLDPRYPKRYRFKAGDSFAPRRFPLAELQRSRANMSERDWEAIYQQNPIQEEGAILKRRFWRKLNDKEMDAIRSEKFLYIIQVYDTAFEEGEESDFTARTTWGVFRHQDTSKMMRYCCVVLERLKKRIAFPLLREEAWESYKAYKPDRVLIEKKASGHSLIQELRRKGVPVTEITVPGGRHSMSKVPRAHAASVVLEQGCVFYPDRIWAQEVINECAEFPFGDHDDLADSCIHAWTWLRKTYHLQFKDEDDEDDEHPPPADFGKAIFG